MAASAGNDAAKAGYEKGTEAAESGGGGGDEETLPELKPVVTREKKHDDPKPEPPEADEFGLTVKPPRRRNWSLDELESPEQAKPPPMEVINGRSLGREKQHGVEVAGGVAEAEEEDQGDTAPAKTDVDGGILPTLPTSAVSPKSPTSAKSPTARPGSSRGARNSGSRPSSSHVAQKQSIGATSEWSHQQLAPHADEEEEAVEDGKWQEMPALAEHRIYDDWGKVLAKSYDEVDDNAYGYGSLGGAGKGYTRVQMDEDAQSATSMDDNTAYLFKDQHARNALDAEDEEGRDVVSQMQTTKELLTEGQRIAYVGVVRLAINSMAQEIEMLPKSKGTKKLVELASEALKMWGQKMMVRMFSHMEIDSAEQVMVEQLADHGVLPSDLTPALMQNARVKSPDAEPETASVASRQPSISSPRPSSTLGTRASTPAPTISPSRTPGPGEDPPPAYTEQAADDFHRQDPSELNSEKLELDIRWTVLCDLFLILIADSTYDARSRTLLERVGEALSVDWQEICRFEKRVTDALEMQEQAEKENWNEEEHMQAREKRARNKRLMVMGLCTVGGGLIIGLSAGALAPVIGAGLAAGFTGIGVAGTGTFLGGTGAAALIGTTGTLIGGSIGMKTSDRRTGAVRTYEYKPLFNNKRVNLIVTVSGWMTGKVDDVRLPFSTVDPIMGDIYSVNWEPEMLQSTGQTIQILGTEALTQTIQQVLGATFLATLMAGLSLPIVLTKLSYLIDNPWSVSCARADSTGLILADSLIDRNLGVRPITLVGFSLGSRVIFSCLRELARRGALGLIQNVYMFGSPVVVKQEEWTRARTVVSGRFVNGYATNDWILAYLFRATSGGIMRVAGLATVDITGIENINVTEEVPGHMAYRGMMPTLLHLVGWAVESEEFTEIEDPDPADHAKRQRELLNEIEEARKELDEKPEKKGIRAFFSRKKAPARKAWETYDETSAQAKTKVLHGDADAAESEQVAEQNANVMFDVDAIRREALQLALSGESVDEIKQHMQIREIQSTMPALKITSPPPEANGVAVGDGTATSGSLQRAQTHDGVGSAAAIGNGHVTPPRRSRDGRDRDETPAQDESEITMSFDSPTRSAHASPPLANGTYRHPSPAADNSHDPPRWDTPHKPDDFSDRPPLRSTQTTPANASSHQPPATGTTNPNFNPWGEDEEFGKEKKDVEMSFE